MRRRLIAALVGVALGTLLLYAGPRAFVVSEMIRDREELGLGRTADLVAEAIDLRLTADLPIDQSRLESLLVGRDDLGIHARFVDGTELQAGSAGERSEEATRSLVDGGAVTVALSTDAVDRRVADALVPTIGFALAATAFAVAVALVLARKLSTPFTRLAHHAELLGVDEGRTAPRAGIAEADDLAAALDRSQARIVELLRAEREFSSNASHQLRTPLSALRLRLEDVSMWPEATTDVRTELAAALDEVDRLADTVTDLLELARSGGITGWRELDLAHTVREAVGRWQDRFDESGRRIVVQAHLGDTSVLGSERAVHHVLDILLENALAHGAGEVDLSVQGLGDDVALRVADEGGFDGTLSELAFERSARSPSSTGSGIGLDLARRIAESAGARLLLVSQQPTVFELLLPRKTQGQSDG